MINEWKKGFSSLRSFFTPFNFYTSIKFLTGQATLLLYEIENSSLGCFLCCAPSLYGSADVFALQKQSWPIPRRFKLDWPFVLMHEKGARCSCSATTILAIFSLFNQASSTKWKLSAVDSQIGFSFLNSAMKVSL